MEAGTLSGRYETGERLGSGGMSNVYKATDRILERQVAVKILAEHLSDDERFVARFRREALAVARLIHPNIVQVYDSGVDDGRHYIVMEYVAGRSGAQILQRHGPVGAEAAAEVGIQACAGLDYAHRRGIIHRDVKPGNLMIVGGPVGSGDLVVKLTDFGIARAIEQTRITQVGSVVGTAAYLSPEQVRGDEATPGTDVYALGVVLYQFLTGRLPYEGSSLAELAVRQQNEKPLPPSTYNSEVPEPLSAAVLRALEGDTNRRYASADEFATGLQMGLEGEDVTSLDNFGGGNTPTRVLGGDTAATRHLDRTTAQTEYRPVPSPARGIEPRRDAPPRHDAPYAGDRQPQASARAAQQPKPRKRSAFSRFVRFILALIALILVAGAVATGVILTTDKAAGVHISKVAGDTVDKVVEEFKGLVSKNKE
jgi:serine/threonine-protein kinase